MKIDIDNIKIVMEEAVFKDDIIESWVPVDYKIGLIESYKSIRISTFNKSISAGNPLRIRQVRHHIKKIDISHEIIDSRVLDVIEVLQKYEKIVDYYTDNHIEYIQIDDKKKIYIGEYEFDLYDMENKVELIFGNYAKIILKRIENESK